MKKIGLLIIVALGSLVAQAGEITYDWPVVNGLPVNNACYTESSFKSLSPVAYCTKSEVVSRQACRMGGQAETCRSYNGGKLYNGEYVVEKTKCVETTMQNIVVDRTVTEVKCIKYAPVDENNHGQCLETGKVTSTIGLQHRVAMWEHVGGEEGDRFLGYRNFSIPACQ